MKIRFAGLEVGTTGDRLGDMILTDFDGSYPELRTSDSEREGRDGVTPGRDFLGVRTLSFNLSSNRANMVGSRETLAAFLAAWRSKTVREDSGGMVPLEFQAADDPQWRRVYGRPRRITDPNFDHLMRQGRGDIECEFDVMEPRIFSGHEESRQLYMFAPPSETGWAFDFEFPLAGEAMSGTRTGHLQVGGTETTPARIEFHGPGRSLQLDGNRGWHVGIRDDVTLRVGEVLEVDPLTGRVQSYFEDAPDARVDRYGALDRRSRLTSIDLSPGSENVFFSGLDETATSYAVIAWREAHASLA